MKKFESIILCGGVILMLGFTGCASKSTTGAMAGSAAGTFTQGVVAQPTTTGVKTATVNAGVSAMQTGAAGMATPSAPPTPVQP